MKDIAKVAGPYSQPFGNLCLQVLGKKAGLAMFSLNIIAQFFVGEGCTVTATRVIFAYSRDGALPLSRLWSKVDSRTKTPVLATVSQLTRKRFNPTHVVPIRNFTWNRVDLRTVSFLVLEMC